MILEYSIREKIDNPVFGLSIIRADGVECEFSRTDEAGVKTGILEGKGKVKIDLGKIYLAPGVYMVKIYVWDKDVIHAYATRREDILRIESDSRHGQTEAVYLPDIKWEFGG